MGAGGGEVEAAAAAGGGGVENPHLVALLAEANWVKPFKCGFGSCKEYLPNGASLDPKGSKAKAKGKGPAAAGGRRA